MTAKRFQRYYKKATIFWHLGMREEGKKEKPSAAGLKKERYICGISGRKAGSLFMP